jgi:hypothetical protein
MGKHIEYTPHADFRDRLKFVREDRNLNAIQVAKLISEETGYHFTGDMYHAIEKGVTKNVPAWMIIAFMRVLGVTSADELFGDTL